MAFEDMVYMTGLNPGFIAAIFLWTLVWKGLALWYSARNGQKTWFIALLLVQSVGILPIIYLFLFSKTPLTQELERRKKSPANKRNSTSRKKRR